MKTFIKVIEIWIPDKERTQLEFGSGLYGELTDFKNASERQHFAYDEGLPGKAWAAGHPLVLSRFEHSYFKRIAEAKKAGLTCGIAMPIFSGDFLLAVVVFLCGNDEEQAGAIEVWRNEGATENTLRVLDGYYGALEQFEKMSRQLVIPKGHGIPGTAWDSGMPVLVEDIGRVVEYARSADAQKAEIGTGLGIPFIQGDKQAYVITFLSAKATPIAKRIQIWIPDAERGQLVCRQSYSKNSNNLAEIFETLTVNKGDGALGRVWLTGMPSISGNQESAYNAELDDLSSMLAIPVIEQGQLKAIVSFLF
ncbi:GAF domain-containing protein [Methylomicrobium sp. Wu6]|uniref:GAF domain-containing protein n=1 Tax=Methylomicrobium sp. Wu6 TaxID=3107928 RepID=UPI002DD6A2C2|nr:GAF domain-containing protein [Methylomicrobium sp. Wu6]MEC4747540.1 GAF domain-containing protein [Methylomicrobium sp. Wu6]